MNLEIFDWNSIVLGVLAACLFAECIILVVRVNSLRNKMESEAETIRNDELVKYEKKRNELEMLLKEREIEMKSEYEDMLSLARSRQARAGRKARRGENPRPKRRTRRRTRRRRIYCASQK